MKLTREQIEALSVDLEKKVKATYADKLKAVANTAKFNNHKAFQLFEAYQELKKEYARLAVIDKKLSSDLRKALGGGPQKYVNLPSTEAQLKEALAKVLLGTPELPSRRELADQIHLAMIEDHASLKTLIESVLKKYEN